MTGGLIHLKDARRAGVAVKLRALRNEAGLNQRQLAKELGWAHDYYGRLERGTHDIGDWLLGRGGP